LEHQVGVGKNEIDVFETISVSSEAVFKNSLFLKRISKAKKR
jgi:hypothetical protein